MRNEKRTVLRKMSFLLIFLISILIHATSAMADEITIVADEWAPYNGKPNSTEPGYGIEIAEHVFEAAGHTVIYKVIPWNRAIMESREGCYNAIIGAVKEEVPDFIFPEEEFGVSENAFFAKRGSTWEYESLESLLTVKIGLIKDYSYGPELDTFFKENKNIVNVQYAYGEDPLLININKLLHERFDIFVEDPNVLLQKTMKMGVSDQIVKVGSIKGGDNVYIAFSPKIEKSKEYAEILTKGIRKLKDSGELEKILAKYGLTYWK